LLLTPARGRVDVIVVCVLLIDRSQFDSDDEVRDRATFYLNVLNEQQKALNLTYIINGTSPWLPLVLVHIQLHTK